MPAVVPFIPLIAQGAGMIGGAIAGKKAQAGAAKRSPEEAAGMAGQTGVANTALGQGQGFLQEGRGNLQQPANYFKTLLSGNRAAMQGAVAAPMAGITDVYRGAQRGLEHSGVRGAARDVASGELNRERASKMSGLITGVQGAAAESLAGIGGQQAAGGAGLLGTAGNVYGNILNQGYENRKYSREEGGKTGAAIGGLVRDLGNVAGGAAAKKWGPKDYGSAEPYLTGKVPMPGGWGG